MKEIMVRRYREGDISKIPGYSEPIPGLETVLMNGDSYTGIAEDGEYVFCAGLSFYWPGHAEAWVHFSENIRNYIRAPKIVQEYLDQLIEKHRLYRVSAHSKVDFHESQRFLEHLGFELEADLKRWGPEKEDYYVYRLLVEDK